MGIRITSNIFLGQDQSDRIGSRIRDYKRFTYQVMLLFSQRTHSELSAELHGDDENGFKALNSYTGTKVVFFTCQNAKESSKEWMEAHQPVADDRILISEIADFFEVKEEDLPAVVLSRNLWSREVVILPKIGSMTVIGPLLRHLTDLANGKHAFSNQKLAAHLNTAFPRLRLVEPERQHGAHVGQLFDQWASTAQRIAVSHPSLKSRRPLRELMEKMQGMYQINPENEASWQYSLSEVFKALSLFAIPAMMTQPVREPTWLTRLDQVTQSKILSVLHAQNQVQMGIQFGRTVIEDWGGFLLGLWGSVERMLNVSLIQLARQTRGIDMPAYFVRYHPNFDKAQSTILIQNRKFNLNGRFKNSALGGELAMFMLGKGRELCEFLWQDDAEAQFQDQLRRISARHGVEPAAFFERLKHINQARNKGCHGEVIDEGAYQAQCDSMLDDTLFPMMLDIRDALNPPAPPSLQMSVELPAVPESRRRERLRRRPSQNSRSIDVGKDFPFPTFAALNQAAQNPLDRLGSRSVRARERKPDRGRRHVQNRELVKDYLSTPGEIHPNVDALFGRRLMGIRMNPMDSLQKALISCQSEADIDSTFQELSHRLNRHARSILEIIDILGRERTKEKWAEILKEEPEPEPDDG